MPAGSTNSERKLFSTSGAWWNSSDEKNKKKTQQIHAKPQIFNKGVNALNKFLYAMGAKIGADAQL